LLQGSAASVICFGRGESDAYSNSGASAMSVGSSFYFYDTNPTNTIKNATVNSGWISSFTLPAGKYQVSFQSHVVFSATGVCGIGLYDAATLISTPMQIGDVEASHGVAFINITSAKTFTFQITQATNVSSVALQGNYPAEFGYLFVLKVE